MHQTSGTSGLNTVPSHETLLDWYSHMICHIYTHLLEGVCNICTFCPAPTFFVRSHRHLLQGLEVAVAKGPPHGRADGHVVIILIVGHHLVTMAWCIPSFASPLSPPNSRQADHPTTTVPPGWLPWRFGVLARLPCSPALAAHLNKAQVEGRSTWNKQNNLFVFHQTIQSQLYGTNLKHFVFKCRDLFSMFIHWFVLRAFIFPGQSFKKDGVTCCSEPGDTWNSDLGSLYTRDALTSSWIKAAVAGILHFTNFCIHSKRNMECRYMCYLRWMADLPHDSSFLSADLAAVSQHQPVPSAHLRPLHSQRQDGLHWRLHLAIPGTKRMFQKAQHHNIYVATLKVHLDFVTSIPTPPFPATTGLLWIAHVGRVGLWAAEKTQIGTTWDDARG